MTSTTPATERAAIRPHERSLVVISRKVLARRARRVVAVNQGDYVA